MEGWAVIAEVPVPHAETMAAMQSANARRSECDACISEGTDHVDGRCS